MAQVCSELHLNSLRCVLRILQLRVDHLYISPRMGEHGMPF